MERITKELINVNIENAKSLFCELSSGSAIICNGIEKFYHLYIIRNIGTIKLFDVFFLISSLITICGFVFTVFYCALEPDHVTLNYIWETLRRLVNKCRSTSVSPNSKKSVKKFQKNIDKDNVKRSERVSDNAKESTLTLLELFKDASILDNRFTAKSQTFLDSINDSDVAQSRTTNALIELPEQFNNNYKVPSQYLLANPTYSNEKYSQLLYNDNMSTVWCDKYSNVLPQNIIAVTNNCQLLQQPTLPNYYPDMLSESNHSEVSFDNLVVPYYNDFSLNTHRLSPIPENEEI